MGAADELAGVLVAGAGVFEPHAAAAASSARQAATNRMGRAMRVSMVPRFRVSAMPVVAVYFCRQAPFPASTARFRRRLLRPPPAPSPFVRPVQTARGAWHRKAEPKGPDFCPACRYNGAEDFTNKQRRTPPLRSGSKETTTTMSRLLQFVSETLSRRTRGSSTRPDMMQAAPLEDHDPLDSYMRVLEDARRSRWARSPRF